MKKITLIALSIIALTSLSGCATTEAASSSAVKAETAQSAAEADAPKTDLQPATVGKRGLKLPNAANADTSKPADKANGGAGQTCVTDPRTREDVCY